MPVDDFGERVDHRQCPQPWIVQDGLGGVTESESADGYVQLGVRQFGQGEFRERDLAGGEEAGHEELVAELHLVHVLPRDRVAAPTQTDLADGRRLPVDLLEAQAHPFTFLTCVDARCCCGSKHTPSRRGSRALLR